MAGPVRTRRGKSGVAPQHRFCWAAVTDAGWSLVRELGSYSGRTVLSSATLDLGQLERGAEGQKQRHDPRVLPQYVIGDDGAETVAPDYYRPVERRQGLPGDVLDRAAQAAEEVGVHILEHALHQQPQDQRPTSPGQWQHGSFAEDHDGDGR